MGKLIPVLLHLFVRMSKPITMNRLWLSNQVVVTQINKTVMNKNFG